MQLCHQLCAGENEKFRTHRIQYQCHTAEGLSQSCLSLIKISEPMDSRCYNSFPIPIFVVKKSSEIFSRVTFRRKINSKSYKINHKD